jgi:hypothetical protein
VTIVGQNVVDEVKADEVGCGHVFSDNVHQVAADADQSSTGETNLP